MGCINLLRKKPYLELAALEVDAVVPNVRSGSGGVLSETFINPLASCPGHGPGADSGEAPTGLQQSSRPLDILVECRGHLRPRREVRTRHDDPAIVTLSATAKALTPPAERTGGSKLDGYGRQGGHGEAEGGCQCRGHGGHGAHSGPCPPPGA
jgi:hypothetical protein